MVLYTKNIISLSPVFRPCLYLLSLHEILKCWCKKKNYSALAEWLSWLEHRSIWQGCRFNPQSEHTQESASECMDKCGNRLIFLSLPPSLCLPLPSPLSLTSLTHSINVFIKRKMYSAFTLWSMIFVSYLRKLFLYLSVIKIYIHLILLFIEFIGESLVNKIIQVSGSQFHNTPSAQYIVCSPHFV